MQNKVRFSHNWNNKLNNKIFTTIRKSDEEKSKYYCDNIGKEWESVLVDEVISKCILRDVTFIEYSKIPFHVLALDTGELDLFKRDNIFKNFGINSSDNVMILTFENMGVKE